MQRPARDSSIVCGCFGRCPLTGSPITGDPDPNRCSPHREPILCNVGDKPIVRQKEGGSRQIVHADKGKSKCPKDLPIPGLPSTMTARKCSIVGQLVKLRAGWQPALQAGYHPAAGCQPAPHEKEHLHAERGTGRPRKAGLGGWLRTRASAPQLPASGGGIPVAKRPILVE